MVRCRRVLEMNKARLCSRATVHEPPAGAPECKTSEAMLKLPSRPGIIPCPRLAKTMIATNVRREQWQYTSVDSGVVFDIAVFKAITIHSCQNNARICVLLVTHVIQRLQKRRLKLPRHGPERLRMSLAESLRAIQSRRHRGRYSREDGG